MNKSFVSIFGLLFIGAFALLALNNFESPKLFIKKPEKSIGKIVDIKENYGIRGYGFVQNLKFVYNLDGVDYFGKKTVGKKHGLQYIGNKVHLKISVNTPTKYKVTGFSQIFNGNFEHRYYAATDNGFCEILFRNIQYTFREYQHPDSLTHELYGTCEKSGDTLIVTPYKISNSQYNKEKIIYLTDSEEYNFSTLKNINTGIEFHER